MEPASLQPPLPPKGRPRLPLPLSSQPILSGRMSPVMDVESGQLSRSAPGQEGHSAASFLNPLYYHVNCTDKFQAKDQRSSSVGETSLHFVGPQKVTTNPVIKFSDSDSDSVYSLESVSSQSVRSERYVEGPLVTPKRDYPEHEYELCEIDRPKVKDIFDLVSFKSPLYGSIKKDKEPPAETETYDVPLKDMVAIQQSSRDGQPPSEPFQTTETHTLEVYDVPSKNPCQRVDSKLDEQILNDEFCGESTYDIPISAILGFDAEILCDVDGMLPPPYPPPPPPLDVEDVVCRPKIPPRPLPPPPIPRRPHLVQYNSEPVMSAHKSSDVVLSFPNPKDFSKDVDPFLTTVPKTDHKPTNTNEIFSWIGPPFPETDKRDLQKVEGVKFNPVVPTSTAEESNMTVPKKTEPRSVVIQETSCSDSVQENRLSKHIFMSLPRFKKLAKTLSDLSLRGSSTSLSSSPPLSSQGEVETNLGRVDQPTKSGVLTCGYLFKVSNNGKEITKKWYSLENSYLCWYPDHKAECPQGRISRRGIAGVCTVPNLPVLGSEVMGDMWWLRVFTVNSHHLLLGARLPSECRDWVRHLAALTAPPGIMSRLENDLQLAGQFHMKEGVSGKWQKGYVVLGGRQLYLWLPELSTLRRIDLQTVMAVEKESSLLQCISAVERGPVFHLNLSQGVIYLQGDWALYTETLLQAVRNAWSLPPRARLADHYLTQDGLPVIVDKCLKFVSTHGSTLEGIYRLSGSSSKVRQLLESFMQDVWQVHLKMDEYSPHDVGSTLKRFLRSLPECLLTEELYPLWAQGSGIRDQVERLKHIRDLLTHLPQVNYNTLKKLIGHLCMITEHSKWNLMPAMNLAPVFGPTLLFRAHAGAQEGLEFTTAATDTVADLISFYSTLFQVDEQELERERSIQVAVHKMKESKIVQKPAGDILVGVYIYSKDWGKCINVRLTPTTTARDVCEYALSAGNIMEPLTKIALMEVVCDGALERPLHHSEFALEVTLRWMSWNQEDSKDNYLCIKHNHIHDAILPVVNSLQGQAFSVFGELSFADSNTRNFKKLQFEFTGAKLRCYKTVKNVPQVVGEWNIEDITWYLGAESKRPPSSKWSFTFIERNVPLKRSKSNPYFGRTVSCRSEDELHKWVAAMLVAEYPQGLVPAVCLPDLLA